MVFFASVLSVKPVADVAFGVELIEHPVCVVLHRSCENDNFVLPLHPLQERAATRPHEKVALIAHLHIVDQRLVQVEHQREGWLCGVLFWQEGRYCLRGFAFGYQWLRGQLLQQLEQ